MFLKNCGEAIFYSTKLNNNGEIYKRRRSY